VIDSPPGGNSNARFDPGETGSIVVSVRNAGGEDAQNVTAQLTSGYPLFTITDPNASFGTIPAGATRNNNSDRFAASAGSAIPQGTYVPCTLQLHSDNWAHDWSYVFTFCIGWPTTPGSLVATHDTGYCKLSVTAFGALGYDTPVLDITGAGFCYPKAAASGLYYGGMLCGNSAGYMVDHYYGVPASSIQSDWVMRDSLRFVPPDRGDQEITGSYTDAGHSAAQGLEVTQTSYQSSRPGYDDFVIVVYDYENTGGSAITGLYSGIMCDFDIGTSTANSAYTNTGRRAAYMNQASAPNPTLGIKLLSPTAANLSVIDHDIYVYPTDTAMNENMKYRFLNGQLSIPSSNRSYDWSVVVSAGPFDLLPGGFHRVAYAMVGGSDENDFLVNCDSAQSWWDAGSDVAEPGADCGLRNAEFRVGPNPFSGGTFIHYAASIPGQGEVVALDATGRVVERTSFEIQTGQGKFYWQPKQCAKGVYFLKVTTPEHSAVIKVLRLE
jgi:hypothetical protein